MTLKGHIRSNKAFYVYLFSSNNSRVKPTLPICFPKIVCALLSPIPTKREGDSSLFALWMRKPHFFIRLSMRPLLCYG